MASKKHQKLAVVVVTLLACSATVSSQAGSGGREILRQFCELDIHGKQLTPDGWHEVASLFVTPTAPRLKNIIVVRDDFVVSVPVMRSQTTAELYVEYITLGQIDTERARFVRMPSVAVREGFDLVVDDGASSKPAIDSVAARWRIKGTPPPPHLTVDTAMTYAAHLRDDAKEAITKKNAETTILALRKLSTER